MQTSQRFYVYILEGRPAIALAHALREVDGVERVDFKEKRLVVDLREGYTEQQYRDALTVSSQSSSTGSIKREVEFAGKKTERLVFMDHNGNEEDFTNGRR